jgi:hypothetical protein
MVVVDEAVRVFSFSEFSLKVDLHALL